MAKQGDSEEEDRDREVVKPSQGGTKWRTALGGAAGGWSDWHGENGEEVMEQGDDEKEDRDMEVTSRIDRMMEEWTVAKRQEEAEHVPRPRYLATKVPRRDPKAITHQSNCMAFFEDGSAGLEICEPGECCTFHTEDDDGLGI